MSVERPVFQGSFTQQEPISDEAIRAAETVLRSGRLHRYNVEDGERSETAALETEFAASVGARYCLACASGGYAMQLALRAWEVAPGAPVLTNAFTLSPVPGAIAAVGAVPVLVETTQDLVIDLDHLARQFTETGAKLLLLSHMRGHIADMDVLMRVAAEHGAEVIEDCAHTMGAGWNGKPTGTFGTVGCFSTQTYKHVNSGEGGFLVSDDPELMARAIVLSGSYMLYERHEATPPPDAFQDIRLDTPNISGRMDNLRASILRPQLRDLPKNAERWRARYAVLEEALSGVEGLRLTHRPEAEAFVPSSFQFLCEGLGPSGAEQFLSTCKARGIELKWFGAPEPQAYTSRHDHWRYLDLATLPQTDAVLEGLFDMRIPLTFSLDDCRLIGRIIKECLEEVRAGASAA